MNAPEHEQPVSPFLLHGGQLRLARARFPSAPEPWIDLSTGICPWPYPIPELAVECWNRLPDALDLEALLRQARAAYRVPEAAALAAVAGTDLAISVLPQLVLPATQVSIVAPTYSSHEKSWAAAGHRVRRVSDLGEIGADGLGVVVNPNNPDGRRWQPAELYEAAARLRERGGFLVVDEAFCDVTPELSVLDRDCSLANIVVLRSFGKFYGLAGVRLGFVATAHPIGAALRQAMSDWPVSGPAIAIGTAALADVTWTQTTRERLAATAARLDDTLRAARFEIAGGTSLFTLARHPRAHLMFERLADQGILVRPFEGHVLRFGLPNCDEHFARLAQALAV